MTEMVLRLSQEKSAPALLKLAKRDIDAGDAILCKAGDFYEVERVRAARLYLSATEHMAMAHRNGASQKHIAGCLGKSPAWVNRLLRWYGSGCEGTPFGSQSKASRDRARVQAAERTSIAKEPGTKTQHGDEFAAAATALATNASARPDSAPPSIPHANISSLKHADTVLDENGSVESVDRERLLDTVVTPSSSAAQKGVDPAAPVITRATNTLSDAPPADCHLPQALNRRDPNQAFQQLAAEWRSSPFRHFLLDSPQAAQLRFLRDVVLPEVGGLEIIACSERNIG